MDYQLLVASEMESFIRVLGTAGPGGCRTRPSARCTPSCTSTCSRPSTGSPPWTATTSGKGSARRCRTSCALYSLVAQIVDWGDRDLERLYQYGRVLLIRLPGRPQVSVDVGDADLSHYRLEFTGQHNVSLSSSDGGDGVVRGHAAEGGGYSRAGDSGRCRRSSRS